MEGGGNAFADEGRAASSRLLSCAAAPSNWMTSPGSAPLRKGFRSPDPFLVLVTDLDFRLTLIAETPLEGVHPPPGETRHGSGQERTADGTRIRSTQGRAIQRGAASARQHRYALGRPVPDPASFGGFVHAFRREHSLRGSPHRIVHPSRQRVRPGPHPGSGRAFQ